MPFLCMLLLISLSSCNNNYQQPSGPPSGTNPYTTIGNIPLPVGFTRATADTGSFAAWLRRLPLKKDKTVYLYNGMLKRNQSAQFAVIDISTGNKDLQQCADAVMRLRAEYLYAHQRFAEIDFSDNNKTHYRLPANASRPVFDKYLEKVFEYCGTLSLDRQLSVVLNFKEIKPGYVLVKGGSPGHAMMVMDVAENGNGEKIYLLAQSYMPAQDMHVVIDPANPHLSPWYQVSNELHIETPEWDFTTSCLKKWNN